jgi:hypothetical protein
MLHQALASNQIERWLPLTDQRFEPSASTELEAAA